VTPKDHTNFLLVLAGYMTMLVVVFVLFFSTTYKRQVFVSVLSPPQP
jgi:hypothetical protein